MALNKKQMSSKVKEDFLKNYSGIIIAKLYPKAKVYAHFIKVEISGIEYDYYPGAQMKNNDGYGRINNVTKLPNVWGDLSNKQFLALLQIPLQQENFSTREEVLSLNDLGLFNGDLD